MEAALRNVALRGDKVLALKSGRFAVDWATAPRGSARVEVLKGNWRHAARQTEVERRLRRDASPGVVNDIASIGRAVRAAQQSMPRVPT
jgi:aspartate aminotransferase-like enzyme